ncbi:hypothetical protein E2C01_102271 [Portunus trituberculatus]|uniref:Uncharacterized protein n=1 Tax=Portunus trituberculatus TaxID=210409 RepID=A0A5B7KI42_PORTR|nr:hypothetical protein [Portunus trituberculatus]
MERLWLRKRSNTSSEKLYIKIKLVTLPHQSTILPHSHPIPRLETLAHTPTNRYIDTRTKKERLKKKNSHTKEKKNNAQLRTYNQQHFRFIFQRAAPPSAPQVATQHLTHTWPPVRTLLPPLPDPEGER